MFQKYDHLADPYDRHAAIAWDKVNPEQSMYLDKNDRYIYDNQYNKN